MNKEKRVKREKKKRKENKRKKRSGDAERKQEVRQAVTRCHS